MSFEFVLRDSVDVLCNSWPIKQSPMRQDASILLRCTQAKYTVVHTHAHSIAIGSIEQGAVACKIATKKSSGLYALHSMVDHKHSRCGAYLSC